MYGHCCPFAGGYAWGAFADAYGRRRCLMVSLAVNSIFGVFSAFARSFFSLLVFRFLSGLGVGGSIPVIFTYFCEFLPSDKRGSYMVILARYAGMGTQYILARYAGTGTHNILQRC